MTLKKYNMLFLILIFLFTGCIPNVTKPIIHKSNIPKWMENPTKEANGKITAIGCSKIHINGKSAQKKLAIQRAIDEIAMQTKTKVNTVNLRVQNNNSSSSINKTSLQEVNDVAISTKILDQYIKKDGTICVWVIKN